VSARPASMPIPSVPQAPWRARVLAHAHADAKPRDTQASVRTYRHTRPPTQAHRIARPYVQVGDSNVTVGRPVHRHRRMQGRAVRPPAVHVASRPAPHLCAPHSASERACVPWGTLKPWPKRRHGKGNAYPADGASVHVLHSHAMASRVGPPPPLPRCIPQGLCCTSPTGISKHPKR
jgi:hypothetical protein